MDYEAQQKLEAQISGILSTANEQNSRDVERELGEIIEARRGVHGRVIFVLRDAPLEIGSLGLNDQIRTLGILDWKRQSKRQRYLKKLADPKYGGPKILAEGDSWFEYPCAKDLIEWIGDTYAVLSLAKAGDTWSDIQDQEGKKYDDRTPMGLFESLAIEKPQLVLLSVGGNEIMGNIEQFVFQYEKDRPRDKYIDYKKFSDTFRLHRIDVSLSKPTKSRGWALRPFCMVTTIRTPATGTAAGNGFGGPLESYRYIGDQSLWRQIVNTMLRRFAHRMYQIARDSHGNVYFVNQLGTIGNSDYNQVPDRRYWHDEMHGTDIGFERLSRKLIEKIRRVSGWP